MTVSFTSWISNPRNTQTHNLVECLVVNLEQLNTRNQDVKCGFRNWDSDSRFLYQQQKRSLTIPRGAPLSPPNLRSSLWGHGEASHSLPCICCSCSASLPYRLPHKALAGCVSSFPSSRVSPSSQSIHICWMNKWMNDGMNKQLSNQPQMEKYTEGHK